MLYHTMKKHAIPCNTINKTAKSGHLGDFRCPQKGHFGPKRARYKAKLCGYHEFDQTVAVPLLLPLGQPPPEYRQQTASTTAPDSTSTPSTRATAVFLSATTIAPALGATAPRAPSPATTTAPDSTSTPSTRATAVCLSASTIAPALGATPTRAPSTASTTAPGPGTPSTRFTAVCLSASTIAPALGATPTRTPSAASTTAPGSSTPSTR